MKRNFFRLLLCALVLTVCSTAMAEDFYLESEAGTIGSLNGREAMVVDLGGTIGKVAVATRNVGAEKASDKMAMITEGDKFKLADANNPEKNGLTDGWYVPSKAELEALKGNLTPNKGVHCVEWKVTETATLYLPTWSPTGSNPYYGKYASSDREQVGGAWECWIYEFLFYDSDNSFGGNDLDKYDEQETENCLIRPFHKLIASNQLFYTSSNSSVVTPNNGNFNVSIVSNTYENGQGIITFNGDITNIGENAFKDCRTLTTVTMPDGLETVGTSAFQDCSRLKHITFSGTITNIGTSAFSGCDDLVFIKLLGTSVPRTQQSFANSGANVGSNTFLVPETAVETYKNSSWSPTYSSTLAGDALISLKTTACSDIENAVNAESTLTVGDKESIATHKSNVKNATNIEDLLNERAKAFYVISLRKAKITALATISETENNMTATLSDDEKTFVNLYKENIESGTDIVTIRQEINNVNMILLKNRRIYYVTIDGEKLVPSNKIPFNVANDNIENEKDEKTGKWRITTLNHDITTIDVMAFCYCSRLSSIILPSTVSRIKQKAFDDCSNLLYVIFKGTQPATIELDHITGSGIFFGSGINVGGTVTLVPSGAATAYRDAGFPNVYDGLTDDLKNKLLGNITTVMNAIKDPENISATINACKDGISNGTDITTVMNVYETAMLAITLQKEKEAASRKIDELVTKANSLDLDGIEDYLALLEKCRSNIVSASGILEVEAAIAQAMADLTPYRYMAKKDLETYLSTNHIHNFSIESYITRIFEATSDETIDAIVNEAKNDFDKIYKARIGDDWYVLKKYRGEHLGDGVFKYYYTLENCPMTFTDAAEYVTDFEFTADEVHYSRDLTPVEGVWQCWYVPFDVTVDNTKFDAAEIEGLLLNADGETIVAFRKLADGATMHANKVYVIRAKAGEGKLELTLRNVMVYDAVQQNKVWYADVPPLVLESAHEYFVFYGHYDYSEPWTLITDCTDWYGFYTLNDKGQFSIRNSSDKIKPQRFWLVVGEQTNGYYPAEQHAAAKPFIDIAVMGDEEDVTGIEASPKSSPEGKGVIYDLMGRKVTSIQKGQIYIVNGKKYVAK